MRILEAKDHEHRPCGPPAGERDRHSRRRHRRSCRPRSPAAVVLNVNLHSVYLRTNKIWLGILPPGRGRQPSRGCSSCLNFLLGLRRIGLEQRQSNTACLPPASRSPSSRSSSRSAPISIRRSPAFPPPYNRSGRRCPLLAALAWRRLPRLVRLCRRIPGSVRGGAVPAPPGGYRPLARQLFRFESIAH
jgi:hypothetical protein